MTVRYLLPLLAAVLAVPHPAAADCSQVVDQIQNDAQAFHAEADKMGMDFTSDELLDPALSSAKDGLKKVATSGEPEAVKSVREGKKQIQDWQKKVSTWNDQVHDVAKCLESPHCNLLDLMKQVNEDLRKWLESLGSEGTAKAAERVNKAASMLESYNKRLASSAMNSASAAVSCMNQSSPEVAKDPVDLRTAPKTAGNASTIGGKAAGGAAGGGTSGTGTAAAGTTAAKGGSHIGTALLVTGVVTAGVVGVAAAAGAAATVSACPNAGDIATPGSGLVATGPDSFCTDYSPCGNSYVRSCAAHICSPGSCSIYYQFNGGGLVVCSNACGSEAEAGSLGSAVVSCAYRAANACQ